MANLTSFRQTSRQTFKMKISNLAREMSCLLVTTTTLVIFGLSGRVAATVICDTCPDSQRLLYPGVGFDLTLDYG